MKNLRKKLIRNDSRSHSPTDEMHAAETMTFKVKLKNNEFGNAIIHKGETVSEVTEKFADKYGIDHEGKTLLRNTIENIVSINTKK